MGCWGIFCSTPLQINQIRGPASGRHVAGERGGARESIMRTVIHIDACDADDTFLGMKLFCAIKRILVTVGVFIVVASIAVGCRAKVDDAWELTEELRYPVRWTDAIKQSSREEIIKALDRPVEMPRGHGLLLRRDFDDTKGRDVTTGREWLEARREGFGALTTFDISMQSWFVSSAGALAHILNARPSRASYVQEISFGTNVVSVLPCTLVAFWRHGLLHQIDNGRVFPGLAKDWEQFARKGDYLSCGAGMPLLTDLYSDVTVSNRSPNEISIIVGGEEDGTKVILSLIAWGDFDGDAIEDLLLECTTYYLGGSGRSYDHVMLTRNVEDGPLREGQLPSIFEKK
jgi:hypothetical protein